MMDATEASDIYARAQAHFLAARQAVVDWMAGETAAGRLAWNRDAPGWWAYTEAEREFLELDTMLQKYQHKSEV